MWRVIRLLPPAQGDAGRLDQGARRAPFVTMELSTFTCVSGPNAQRGRPLSRLGRCRFAFIVAFCFSLHHRTEVCFLILILI